MNADFYSPQYGTIPFVDGLPPHLEVVVLPGATAWWATGEYGTIVLQEVTTDRFRLRFLIFQLIGQIKLLVREGEAGLQSLLALKGNTRHGVLGQKMQLLNEGQFTLLKAAGTETQTIITPGKECQLLHTYYPPGSYADLLPLFPSLQQDLDKPEMEFLLPFPRPVRHSVLDAIREILYEHYQPQLERTYRELKLKQSLFTQLAQAYTEKPGRPSTPLEKEKALAARRIIEQDITKHYSNDELAAEVNWSESSLKRAFRQEFGIGMYEYLRSLRMQKARELLLQGEQVKSVAPAVGMRPTNFTTEFQRYFGYKATSLHQVNG